MKQLDIRPLSALKTEEEIDKMSDKQLSAYKKLLEKRYEQEQINIMANLDHAVEEHIKNGVEPKLVTIVIGKLKNMPISLDSDDVYTHGVLDIVQATRFDFKYLSTDEDLKDPNQRELIILNEMQKYKDSH